MKKILTIILFFFLISSLVFPGDILKVGAYAGYFSPKEEILDDIYGGNDVIYGLKIGVHIWQGFYAFLSAMQYNRVGETLLGDITRLQLNPINISLRYTFSFGTVNPYLESGFTHIYFKEKSDIGDTSDGGSGFSLDGGIEFKLSRRFILDVGVKYSRVVVKPGGFDVELGGFQGGISFLVNF